VVAREGLLDFLGDEALVLGGGVEQVVEGEPAIVERGQATPPEFGVLKTSSRRVAVCFLTSLSPRSRR
jgi:hypothetical protein